MHVVQRQVPPHVANLAEVAQQLAHDGLGLPAVGALEVAVLDERDRRFERAADVVALGIDVDGRGRSAARRVPSRARIRARRGSSAVARNSSHVIDRRAERGAEDAELRLLELRPVERERRDEQRDGEADAGDRAAAGDGDPADRRLQPAARQTRDQPRAAEDPERLADDVAERGFRA